MSSAPRKQCLRSWHCRIIAPTLWATLLAWGGASADAKPTHFGVGAQARQLQLTRGYAEVWTDAAPPGTRTRGGSIQFSGEGERLEFVVGLGYDDLRASNGYYLQRGGRFDGPGHVDYTEFDKLKMYSADAVIVGTWRPHPMIGLRYGAGLGIGIVRGNIYRTDAVCESDNLERDCEPDPMAVQDREAVDIPPVIPVLRGLVGLQLRPVKALAFNIDLGFRNVPYFGASAMLYLW